MLLCLALLLCAAPVLPAAEARRSSSPGDGRAHAYGPRERQRLVVHGAGARAPGGRPAVVLLHGGYWYQGRSRGWVPWMRHFVEAGTVVFDVDYRSNAAAAWPAQRNDILRALRWIRARAGRLGVDPERLVLLGSSAGGQVAAAVGTYGAGRERVAGVVALSPPLDPLRTQGELRAAPGVPGREPRLRKTEHLRANAARLAGCPSLRAAPGTRCGRVWRDMAAARHASGADDAPMLLVHARRDFVPFGPSLRLARAQRARGMPADGVTVLTVPGAAHGGVLLRLPRVARAVLDWTAARTRE
ncbi:alpha/beta hydrolase [Streptomyces sp. HNM0574]|nr:alpha/beta hydrolase [Streptomyces sp. HNM0574]